MKNKFLTVLIALSGVFFAGMAQEKNAVAFYNLENFYDTVPSRFYDDSDFTPAGRKEWNTARYRRKIANIGRVIDEMSADFLGIAEVENEAVVQDLVNSLNTDYNYIHANLSDKRGMDLAILYKGDKFFPDSVALIDSNAGREFLYARGLYCGVEIHFVLCHMPSRLKKADYSERAFYELRHFLDALNAKYRKPNIVLMGDFNASPVEEKMKLYLGRSGAKNAFMTNVLNDVYRSSFGSYFADNTWLLFDNIFVNPEFFERSGFNLVGSGVFSQMYMLRPESGGKTSIGGAGKNIPFRTFEGNKYLKGYSDHLPVFMVLED